MLKLANVISILAILIGVVLAAIWFYRPIVVYAALNEAWTRLMKLSKTHGVSTQRLLVANTVQDAHRINMLAEIAGMMIGALIAAVGGLGLVVFLTCRKDAA